MLNWVWIAGWGSEVSVWQAVTQQLPGQHHYLALPDDITEHQEPIPLNIWLQQAILLLPQNSILIGWSLGGMLATALTQFNLTKIKALITLAANPKFVASQDWPHAMAQETYQRFCEQFQQQPQATLKRFFALQTLGDSQGKALAHDLNAHSSFQLKNHSVWQHTLHWLNEMDHRQTLAALKIPQLHVLGAHDALVPVAVKDGLPSQADVHIFPHAGHALPLHNPTELAAILNQWVASFMDKNELRKAFGKAAPQYDQFAHLQKTVAQSLVTWIGDTPLLNPVLDLGCGTGFVAQLIQKTDLMPILLDIAEPMARTAQLKLNNSLGVVGDAEALPFADNSLATVISSLAVQWCASLSALCDELARVLQPKGTLMLATMGTHTLKELKNAWAKLDHYVHVNQFHSLQQWQIHLNQAGFKVEAVQNKPAVVQYSNLMHLLKELKAIGAHNINYGRNPGLTRRKMFKDLEQHYRQSVDESSATGENGVLASGANPLPATYDILFIKATKL